MKNKDKKKISIMKEIIIKNITRKYFELNYIRYS